MQHTQQKGIALVMALIMLLVITILGVSAVRMAGLDTQVAGNSIYSSMVFQGAESALSRASSDFFTIEQSVRSRNETIEVPESYFNPIETVNGGATLKSSATIKFQGGIDTPPVNGVANDSEFKYQVVQINAMSSLAATAAKDNHLEGIAIPIAP